MLEAIDYSARRGAIVPLMDRIYAVMLENAQRNRISGLPLPPNIIIWRQDFRKMLTDVCRRWVFALDGSDLAGFLFYHSESHSQNIFIDECMIAWAYRNNGLVFPLLLDKFQFDRQVKEAEAIFAGAHIRQEADKEILAYVGFKDGASGEYQKLGALAEAVEALKIRYGK
jgi:hypothetical protein